MFGNTLFKQLYVYVKINIVLILSESELIEYACGIMLYLLCYKLNALVDKFGKRASIASARATAEYRYVVTNALLDVTVQKNDRLSGKENASSGTDVVVRAKYDILTFIRLHFK